MPGSKGVHYPIPMYGHQNSWLAYRKFDIHTGIDLFADAGDLVVSMYDGEVVDTGMFTTSEVSPWWHSTEYVSVCSEICGYRYVTLYGEICTDNNILIGSHVRAGNVLGTIKQIIKNPKPGQHPSMLHLEMHDDSYEYPWSMSHQQLVRYGDFIADRPSSMHYSLMDPTGTVIAAKANYEKNSLQIAADEGGD